jgi:phosphoglycerate dehydrogenase-like enzyme
VKTVLVTGGSLVTDDALALIRDRGFHVRHIKDDCLDAEGLHEALIGASGYIIGGDEQALADHFDRASALRAVAYVGTDFKANMPGWKRAFDLDIAVINTPGANTQSVAELTVLMLLSMARPYADGWAKAAPGTELMGRSLGIIGLGRIGARVARIARLGFGMRTAYFARHRQPTLESALDISYQSRADLIANNDIISLHRPGPVGTQPPELVRADFEAMRRGTIVINAGHVGLIDPNALAWAIDARGIRAAVDGIGSGDVWETLMAKGQGRFLAGAQMGYYTWEANRRASLLAAERLCAVLNGKSEAHVNNPRFDKAGNASRG